MYCNTPVLRTYRVARRSHRSRHVGDIQPASQPASGNKVVVSPCSSVQIPAAALFGVKVLQGP